MEILLELPLAEKLLVGFLGLLTILLLALLVLALIPSSSQSQVERVPPYGTRVRRRRSRRTRVDQSEEDGSSATTVVPVFNTDGSISPGLKVGGIVIDMTDGHAGISAGGIGIDPFPK